MMLIKVALLALVLAAAASPARRTASGVRIPLHKLSSLTRPDGTFDSEKAILHTIAIKNKYRRNLINLERNSGREVFNRNAEALPVVTAPDTRRRHSLELLTELQGGVAWGGTISVGTPRQNFVINFDVGSSDFWVTSASCTIAACATKAKYDASASWTSAPQPGNVSITYIDGSKVSGPLFTDTVTIADVTTPGLFFMSATDMPAPFGGVSIDGILGLAFPALSAIGRPSFFNTALEQGAVASGVFSFKLAHNHSSLFLGGTDRELFTGHVEFHALSSRSGFWQIGGASILINSTTILSGFETIMDSAGVIFGPPSAVESFYSNIPGSVDSGNGFHTFPCATPPAVSFNWGGKNWEISAENFNLGQVSQGSDQCSGAIVGQDLGLGDNVWVVGDSFMKNVYTVFSIDQNSVGFAALA